MTGDDEHPGPEEYRQKIPRQALEGLLAPDIAAYTKKLHGSTLELLIVSD